MVVVVVAVVAVVVVVDVIELVIFPFVLVLQMIQIQYAVYFYLDSFSYFNHDIIQCLPNVL